MQYYLTISNKSANSATKKIILAQLQKLDLKNRGMAIVLKEFSDGNIHLIDELLASNEKMILKVMLNMPESNYSIDDRVSRVMATLQTLAITSMAHPPRQLFERSSAFHVT